MIDELIALLQRIDAEHKQRLLWVAEGMLMAEDMHKTQETEARP